MNSEVGKNRQRFLSAFSVVLKKFRIFFFKFNCKNSVLFVFEGKLNLNDRKFCRNQTIEGDCYAEKII